MRNGRGWSVWNDKIHLFNVDQQIGRNLGLHDNSEYGQLLFKIIGSYGAKPNPVIIKAIGVSSDIRGGVIHTGSAPGR